MTNDLAPVEPKRQRVEIEGTCYYLERKNPNEGSETELTVFIHKYWSEAQRETPRNLPQALKIRTVLSLKNDRDEIVAAGVYAVATEGHSHLELFVVRPDHRGKKLGPYLARLAAQEIVEANEAAGKQAKTSADARTKEGGKLLDNLRNQFGDKLKLRVNRLYAVLKEENLPSDLEFIFYYKGFEYKEDSLKKLTQNPMELEEMEQALEEERVLMVVDGKKNVVAFAAYKRLENAHDDHDVCELSHVMVHPDHADQKIAEIIKNEWEDKIVVNGRILDIDAETCILTTDSDLVTHALDHEYELITLEEYSNRTNQQDPQKVSRLGNLGYQCLWRKSSYDRWTAWQEN